MKLVYLASCHADITWVQEYYLAVFPEGGKSGWRQIIRMQAFLKSNPHIGHPIDNLGLRKISIPKTPFSFVYRIKGDVIQVVRLWDSRAKRPPKWHD
ncbi:MAG: type II toxin-antitoxin system RelE/ParE family toxin [Rhizobiales bacterium]|nr:type II toxin-antitoxin system RelE/ParE family toxin [Hyphomicrobiales bacterium]MBI3673378.1 type II toxin-antitoxin system RelE/ParE family toxin [Hyphomicrobiales bacterium]